jgi:integrase/recombinase XerD
MTTTTPSAALVPAMPVFTNTERLALAGFLAGYSGLTREAYALDLRQFASWCHQHHLRLFGARRADIECFARDLEARGRARATVTRRTVRRIARRAGITKPVGPHTLRHAFITAAQMSGVASDASVPGKRDHGAVRERKSARQCPQRAVRAKQQVRQVVTSPCCSGCHDVASSSVVSQDRMMHPRQRQNRTNGGRLSQRRVLRGDPFDRVGKPLTTSFDAGVPLRDVQEAASHADPRTTMRYDRARASLDRHATYIVAAYIAGAAR